MSLYDVHLPRLNEISSFSKLLVLQSSMVNWHELRWCRTYVLLYANSHASPARSDLRPLTLGNSLGKRASQGRNPGNQGTFAVIQGHISSIMIRHNLKECHLGMVHLNTIIPIICGDVVMTSLYSVQTIDSTIEAAKVTDTSTWPSELAVGKQESRRS